MAKIHRTSEQWAEIIRAQKKSGMSREGWCKQNGVSPASFYNAIHRKGLKRITSSKGEFKKFVAAGTESANGHIRIELKNGSSIHVSNDNKEGLKTVLEVINA